MGPCPYISIVIPVYNEEKNLEELYRRLTQTLDPLGKSYEIILTNDGSRDRSSELLRQLHERRPHQIRVIEFNGNFGQHMAIMAGFESVRGTIIITMDADLQNPPEEIPKLIAAMEAGHDVVNTFRMGRRDLKWRRFVSWAHNQLRALMLPKLKMTDEGCMLRAYHRRIVDLMASTGETTTFIPALALSYAVSPTEIGVQHDLRFAGESNYNFYKLIRYNFDLVTGFSFLPLQALTLLGSIVTMSGALFLMGALVRCFRVGFNHGGLLILFAILFFLMGCLLLGLGLVGEYIGRIYQEVRKRPRFVVRARLEALETECEVSLPKSLVEPVIPAYAGMTGITNTIA